MKYFLKTKSGIEQVYSARTREAIVTLILSRMSKDKIERFCPALPEGEYREAREEYYGWCASCKEITNFSGVEPDAEEYECDACCKPKVYGIEQALMMGLFTIVSDSEIPVEVDRESGI